MIHIAPIKGTSLFTIEADNIDIVAITTILKAHHNPADKCTCAKCQHLDHILAAFVECDDWIGKNQKADIAPKLMRLVPPGKVLDLVTEALKKAGMPDGVEVELNDSGLNAPDYLAKRFGDKWPKNYVHKNGTTIGVDSKGNPVLVDNGDGTVSGIPLEKILGKQ